MQRIFVGFALFLLMAISPSQLKANELVFTNGFESGSACGWSSSDCSLSSLLQRLESANTVSSLNAALLAALEATGGSVPPEVIEALTAAAGLGIQFPSTRGAFLTIEQAHQLATLSQANPPTLQQALSALTTDVQAAYTNPGAAASKAIVLMFSSTSQMPSPLPLSATSPLSLTGSFLYVGWLARKFPTSFLEPWLITPSECRSAVLGNAIAAATQVSLRNIATFIYRLASVVLNSALAVANCSSIPPLTLASSVLSVAKACAIDRMVSWVQVNADAECIANVPNPPLVGSCLVAGVPCLGQIDAIIANSVGVGQAVENMVNGVCTVINSRQGLLDACNEECPTCSELQVETPCGFGNPAACFDPLNSLPVVSCEPTDDPGCPFGSPEITSIVGPNVIPGGSSINNRIFFRDENAGINWIQADVLEDSCGGCWLPAGWNPGVSQLTSGSFDFNWWCQCGGSTPFMATYQLRLFDSQGHESPPYVRQVVCDCTSSLAPASAQQAGGLIQNP